MKLFLYDLSLSCDSPTTSFRLPTSIYLYFYVETLNSLNQLCQDWDDDKPPVYQPLSVLLRQPLRLIPTPEHELDLSMLLIVDSLRNNTLEGFASYLFIELNSDQLNKTKVKCIPEGIKLVHLIVALNFKNCTHKTHLP